MSMAERVRTLEGSPTLALAAKAKALLKAGKPVIDLSAGEPDFPTPEPIKQAGIRAIHDNRTVYTPASGIPELRAAIAQDLTTRQGVSYEPSQVLVTSGAKHALYNAFQALCDPGDEVIIFAPYWVSYPAQVHLAGGRARIVATTEAQGYQPDLKAIQAALTPRTKAIVLNSPSNPTGALMERERLQAIARLAMERGIMIISDEIYDRLVYPPAQACSLLQAEPSAAAHTLIVNGVSKTYSMTGWRIGYIAGPKPLVEAMGALQSHSTSNPTSISQYAALAAFTQPIPDVAAMLHEFHQRRDRFVGGLNQLPGLSCFMPGGAFYAWCNITQLGQPAAVIAARWLEDIFVVGVPGEGFGSADYIRFSFAASSHSLQEGLARLASWLRQQKAAA
ncbi:MAG: pyridoxal phosphate-dependent aminotransferase [Candidatus Omnitrophica bacterium]|nr:pyridoxal phosphate-dependent aminotransferase [Candidatus Omnitrophota bacterium]